MSCFDEPVKEKKDGRSIANGRKGVTIWYNGHDNVTKSENANSIGSQSDKAKRDAAISEDVYESTSKLQRENGVWRLSEEELSYLGLEGVQFVDEDSGFKSALYFDSNSNEFIYAFAGTDGFIDPDMLANFQQGVGKFSTQHDMAINNTGIIKYQLGINIQNGKLGNSSFSSTGHSLGGGLASLAAARWNLSANTFNAAGINANTLTRYRVDRKNIRNTNAYYVKGEVLSTLQDNTVASNALGNRIKLKPSTNGSNSKWFTPFGMRLYRGAKTSGQLHSISEVRKSLK